MEEYVTMSKKRRACSNDSDTTYSENDSIGNDDDGSDDGSDGNNDNSDDDSDDQLEDDAFN
jgi:hypothetical protein